MYIYIIYIYTHTHTFVIYIYIYIYSAQVLGDSLHDYALGVTQASSSAGPDLISIDSGSTSSLLEVIQ
jgi:hypothetical protein